MKTDLKETIFAPYKLKFNRAVLEEKIKIYENQSMPDEARTVYKKYLLPDGVTNIEIETGETEKEIIDQLMLLYQNSGLVKQYH